MCTMSALYTSCCITVLRLQALDGRVERDGLGKEKRYPVILSAKEKNIARTVSIAFKVQQIQTNFQPQLVSNLHFSFSFAHISKLSAGLTCFGLMARVTCVM